MLNSLEASSVQSFPMIVTFAKRHREQMKPGMTDPQKDSILAATQTAFLELPVVDADLLFESFIQSGTQLTPLHRIGRRPEGVMYYVEDAHLTSGVLKIRFHTGYNSLTFRDLLELVYPTPQEKKKSWFNLAWTKKKKNRKELHDSQDDQDLFTHEQMKRYIVGHLPDKFTVDTQSLLTAEIWLRTMMNYLIPEVFVAPMVLVNQLNRLVGFYLENSSRPARIEDARDPAVGMDVIMGGGEIEDHPLIQPVLDRFAQVNIFPWIDSRSFSHYDMYHLDTEGNLIGLGLPCYLLSDQEKQ